MSEDDDIDPHYPMREQFRRARTERDMPPPDFAEEEPRPAAQPWRFPRPGILGIVSFSVTAFVAGFIALVFITLPDLQRSIAKEQTGMLSVTVLDAKGDEVGSRGRRTAPTVPLGEMPPYLIKAVLATEDRRFYEHGGFDARGIARAMWRNLRSFGFVEGGSTITQQVAKNLYLDNSRTIWRKAQEALITLWLENNLSKEEILTLYLNRIYMGAGNYGMDAAARYYFGKSVRDVSLPEAAVLAGLPKAPTRYAPTNDLAQARARANQVLDRLVSSGSLTAEEVAGARQHPAEVLARREGEGREYFVDWVAEQVRTLFPDATGRFIVHTTLDPRRQAAAEKAVEEALSEAGKERHVSQGALVALAPDGAVLAMVGGRSYVESQFNRAAQAKRQPGSAFKPIVYLAALETGYTPDSPVTDEPVSMGGWTPRNASTRDWGTVSLATALSNSINTISVQVGDKVGIDRITASARRLGIESALPRNLSVVLGSAEVSLLELTSAYSAFGNEGRRATPYGISRIEAENGDVVYRHEPAEAQAITRAQAHDMTYMLRQVMTEGTGRGAALGDRLAAGKTGTSQDYRDAWFVGYTGREVAGVWFGNDDNTPTGGASGGNFAAVAWRNYMAAAEAGQPPAPLPGAARNREAPVVAATRARSGFFTELSDLFNAAPKLEARNDESWGGGFRRGGQTIERGKR
ncbi:penicillin-binding protein, 1A family [Parvibaculum lavamentivorans DS-1]|uniref:Penicillin-binding protein, 1A family n=1 Tax=Parvibaculum lavamentivorans (strain DS-1 / DSM 13023 / NCIMB 13966) TaxID=402881 RepID=A7HRI7_PARL1|nr:PBP1A family penicillin-binding protein [Parvibaculum lavamentivorans]ABS62520.1 penicillin-binding protein, 1A family [Parvibaculum lavamentivorans DS-1]